MLRRGPPLARLAAGLLGDAGGIAAASVNTSVSRPSRGAASEAGAAGTRRRFVAEPAERRGDADDASSDGNVLPSLKIQPRKGGFFDVRRLETPLAHAEESGEREGRFHATPSAPGPSQQAGGEDRVHIVGGEMPTVRQTTRTRARDHRVTRAALEDTQGAAESDGGSALAMPHASRAPAATGSAERRPPASAAVVGASAMAEGAPGSPGHEEGTCRPPSGWQAQPPKTSAPEATPSDERRGPAEWAIGRGAGLVRLETRAGRGGGSTRADDTEAPGRATAAMSIDAASTPMASGAGVSRGAPSRPSQTGAGQEALGATPRVRLADAVEKSGSDDGRGVGKRTRRARGGRSAGAGDEASSSVGAGAGVGDSGDLRVPSMKKHLDGAPVGASRAGQGARSLAPGEEVVPREGAGKGPMLRVRSQGDQIVLGGRAADRPRDGGDGHMPGAQMSAGAARTVPHGGGGPVPGLGAPGADLDVAALERRVADLERKVQLSRRVLDLERALQQTLDEINALRGRALPPAPAEAVGTEAGGGSTADGPAGSERDTGPGLRGSMGPATAEGARDAADGGDASLTAEKAGYRRRLAGLRALLPVAPVDDAVELSRWVLGGGNLAGAAGLHKIWTPGAEGQQWKGRAHGLTMTQAQAAFATILIQRVLTPLEVADAITHRTADPSDAARVRAAADAGHPEVRRAVLSLLSMLGPARAVKSAGSADMVAQTLADFVRRDGEGLRQARAGRRGTAGPVAEDGAGGGDPVGRLWESTAALADVVAATAYAPGPESRLTRRAELARRLAEAEALVWEAGMDVPVDAGAAEAAADVAGLAHASWWRGGDLGPRLTALERMEAALAQLSVEPQTTGKRDTLEPVVWDGGPASDEPQAGPAPTAPRHVWRTRAGLSALTESRGGAVEAAPVGSVAPAVREVAHWADVGAAEARELLGDARDDAEKAGVASLQGWSPAERSRLAGAEDFADMLEGVAERALARAKGMDDAAFASLLDALVPHGRQPMSARVKTAVNGAGLQRLRERARNEPLGAWELSVMLRSATHALMAMDEGERVAHLPYLDAAVAECVRTVGDMEQLGQLASGVQKLWAVVPGSPSVPLLLLDRMRDLASQGHPTTPQCLASVAWCLARTPAPLSPDAATALAAAAGDPAAVRGLYPASAAAVLAALVGKGVRPSQQAVLALCDAAVGPDASPGRRGATGSRRYSLPLWALASLGFAAPGPFVADAVRRLLASTPRVFPPDAGMALWAIARCRDLAVEQGRRELTGTRLGVPPGVPMDHVLTLASYVPGRAGDFMNVGQLAAACWGLRRLGGWFGSPRHVLWTLQWGRDLALRDTSSPWGDVAAIVLACAAKRLCDLSPPGGHPREGQGPAEPSEGATSIEPATSFVEQREAFASLVRLAGSRGAPPSAVAVLQAAADSACAGGDGHDAEHIQARVRDLDATLEPRVFVFRLSDGNAL